jgi:excinuclease ABC subunit C
MQIASEQMQFERAQYFLNKLNLLEKFQTKSLVVNRSLTDIDVITIASTGAYGFINYMMVKEGSIIFSKSVEVKKQLEESDDELILYALQELRAQSRSTNSTVFSNVPIALKSDAFEFVLPKIGDKKKLVDLSLKNALELKRKKEILREGKKTKAMEILSILQQDMRLPGLPRIIECFDNSNFQGTTPVASMVRFEDGKPDKKNYRHFNIKTVEGPDDFASMKEIVGRRYKRVLEESLPLPHLILIDGGKGQLSSACEALKELDLYGKIPIAGIAKKLEEIYYPEDPFPLHISKKSPGLLLLQQIRDEAHRFAITFHRKKRSKSTIKTELEDVPGIGPETVNKLLKHYKSTKKILEAPVDELEKIIGNKKAAVLKALTQKKEAY